MIATWKLPSSKVYHGLNNALGIYVHEKHYQVLPTQMVPISALANGLNVQVRDMSISWWHHQMETLSALPAICSGNSPVTGEFPAQRPATRSFDVFFDLRPNKRLSKQWWGWWFETPLWPLWRQCIVKYQLYISVHWAWLTHMCISKITYHWFR